METNYNSSRKQQRKIIMLVLLIFIISIVITTIYSIAKAEKTDEEITILTTAFQAEIVDNEEQTVTGTNGENDTLIPATVEKVVDAKVLQVSVNNSSIEVSMIGISIPKEKEQETINYLNELFSNSKEVWLQYDEMTVNENNQHLCYIWLSKDINMHLVSSCKNYMLQVKLISEGLAEPVEEYPNSRYEYAISSLDVLLISQYLQSSLY